MSSEPIAIIGMGCRLPMAPDPEAFWDLLHAGRSAITEVPAGRWDADALYAAEPRTPGRMRTRWGAFLDDVYGFDAPFFRIMPIEAPRIDPQHRLVLEAGWEALEYAGIDPTRLAGSLAGVFVGVSHSDHDRLLYEDRTRIDGYNGPNTYHCFAANRLSYFLKLRGPSLVVDGACSSSLAAIHLACQSLRGGDCDLALAGGVNLNLTPDEFIALSFLGVLSAGERGRPFAEDADGYVRGEGCGIVVLKRLEDAQADGDNVLAVIRGSALNHNGLSNGITAPSGAAQEEVIRRALSNAGVAPEDVTHVEAMGTGTALGDPIEVDALAAVYAATGREDRPCWVTSVKANIGHAEAASGVASLIKVILALQHQQIPPQLNIERLNPRIRTEGTRLDFPRSCEPWSAAADPRIAAVSSFGFGGSNAHLIVEEAPLRTTPAVPVGPDVQVFTLSARTSAALTALARRYVAFFDRHPGLDLADVCFTASTGRTHWPQRLAVVTESLSQLRDQLATLLAGKTALGVFAGSAREAELAAASDDAPSVLPPAASSVEGWPSLMRSLAQRYVAGESIPWGDLYAGEGRRTPLPTYPFERVQCRFDVG